MQKTFFSILKLLTAISLSSLMIQCEFANKLASKGSDSSTSPAPIKKEAGGLGINIGVYSNQDIVNNLGDIGSWYYNYSPYPDRDDENSTYETLPWAQKYQNEFVPMITTKWFKSDVPGEGGCPLIEEFSNGNPDSVCSLDYMKQQLTKVKEMFSKNNQPQYLISFNEPYKQGADSSPTGDYHISPSNAVKAFSKLVNVTEDVGLKLISPSASIEASAVTWMSEFLKICLDNKDAPLPCKIESIHAFNIHEYKCNTDYWVEHYENKGFKNSLIEAIDGYQGYDWSNFILNKPIWVTETNCNWESDFASAQSQGDYIRTSEETCLRATGQKEGYGKGSLKTLLEMGSEIERFAWWNTYADPYKNSDVQNGITNSSINRIVAARMYDESHQRTKVGQAYYLTDQNPDQLKSLDCSSTSAETAWEMGLVRIDTGEIYIGFGGGYCKYANISQVDGTYGPDWREWLFNMKTLPVNLSEVNDCGPKQGLYKEDGNFFYVYRQGYTCWIDDISKLEEVSGLTNPELIKETDMSALGVNAVALPGYSCFND